MKRSIFISVAMVILFAGCSMKEYKLFQDKNNENANTVTVIPEDVYQGEVNFENIIAPNDRVDITVYIQAGKGSQQMTSILTSEDTSNSSTVQENVGLLVTKQGTVRLPLVGSVDITGYTEDQASNALIKEYQKYIRNPYVVVEIKNQRVIVMGEINDPGIVSVSNGTMNVLEAIARSGDFTDMASRHNIKVLRGDLRKPEVRLINLTDMNAIGSSSMYLKPNDIVYIQPRDLKGYNQAFQDVMPFWDMLTSILNPMSLRKDIISQ